MVKYLNFFNSSDWRYWSTMTKVIKVYNGLAIYFFIGLYLITLIPSSLNIIDKNNIFFLLVIYFLFGSLLFVLFIKHKVEVFEPIVVISAIYYLMFIITPILNIINQDTTFFGMSTSSSTIKASLIFFIGYISFLLGYFKYGKSKNKKSDNINIYGEGKRDTVIIISIIIWTIGFIFNSIYVLSKGTNFIYMITMGMLGEVNQTASVNTPLGFVGMFGFLMIGSWMYIGQYSHSKTIRIVTYILMFFSFGVRGFRFILVIIIMAPIILYYIKRNRKPKLFTIISLILIIITMIGFIGLNRTSIRTGGGMTLDGFGLEIIIKSLNDNFSQYKTFYLMVDRIPRLAPHSWGVKTFLNPIIMIIPRMFWPGKISLGSDSDVFLNDAARIAGSAYPNIGEFYMDFGIIGVIVFMFLFGKMCGTMVKFKNRKNSNINTYIAYSIFVPTTLQLVIRGHMATNLYLVIFLFAPIFIIRAINNKK